jgi:DNA repair protein RadC
VVKSALEHAAAALIFAHNHPSGDPAPSPDDLEITRKLVQACSLMGITVHEHLIVGSEGFYSFADHGDMARLRSDRG